MVDGNSNHSKKLWPILIEVNLQRKTLDYELFASFTLWPFWKEIFYLAKNEPHGKEKSCLNQPSTLLAIVSNGARAKVKRASRN